MTELLQEDLHKVLISLPKDIRELMKRHNLMLGGGFIRETVLGDKPNDIDLFGESSTVLQLAATELYHSRNAQARVLNTKNAITQVQPPRTAVQYITRWVFNRPAPLVESFDFSVCQAVVYWDFEAKQWDSLIADHFYADLASKRLVYTAPNRAEDAGGSLLRMRKFLNRGYHISAENMAAVIARLTTRVRWESSMSGNEEDVTKVLAGLLREVDPLHIVDGCQPIDVEHTTPGEDDENTPDDQGQPPSVGSGVPPQDDQASR